MRKRTIDPRDEQMLNEVNRIDDADLSLAREFGMIPAAALANHLASAARWKEIKEFVSELAAVLGKLLPDMENPLASLFDGKPLDKRSQISADTLLKSVVDWGQMWLPPPDEDNPTIADELWEDCKPCPACQSGKLRLTREAREEYITPNLCVECCDCGTRSRSFPVEEWEIHYIWNSVAVVRAFKAWNARKGVATPAPRPRPEPRDTPPRAPRVPSPPVHARPEKPPVSSRVVNL